MLKPRKSIGYRDELSFLMKKRKEGTKQNTAWTPRGNYKKFMDGENINRSLWRVEIVQ